jgi:hypothetical protein
VRETNIEKEKEKRDRGNGKERKDAQKVREIRNLHREEKIYDEGL